MRGGSGCGLCVASYGLRVKGFSLLEKGIALFDRKLTVFLQAAWLNPDIFIIYHSTFDVGSSMFDVHQFLPRSDWSLAARGGAYMKNIKFLL